MGRKYGGYGFQMKDWHLVLQLLHSCDVFEQGRKVGEMVFGKRLSEIVTNNERQFGFMPEKGIIDAVFI